LRDRTNPRKLRDEIYEWIDYLFSLPSRKPDAREDANLTLRAPYLNQLKQHRKEQHVPVRLSFDRIISPRQDSLLTGHAWWSAEGGERRAGLGGNTGCCQGETHVAKVAVVLAAEVGLIVVHPHKRPQRWVLPVGDEEREDVVADAFVDFDGHVRRVGRQLLVENRSGEGQRNCYCHVTEAPEDQAGLTGNRRGSPCGIGLAPQSLPRGSTNPPTG
jgi:hypothetical protein